MAMPLVKPMTTMRGMKRTAAPRPVKSHEEQNDAGHDGDHGEAAHAEAGDDAGDDDDECAGGSTDLGARATEGGDEESGDDGGVEAGLRRDAGGDAEGHGKRKCDQADRDAGEQVVEEHLGGIGTEGQNRLGQIRIADGHGGLMSILRKAGILRCICRALGEVLEKTSAGIAGGVVVLFPALRLKSVGLIEADGGGV